MSAFGFAAARCVVSFPYCNRYLVNNFVKYMQGMGGSRGPHSQRSTGRARSGVLDRLEELEEDREGSAWNPPRSSVILSVCYSGGMVGAAVYDQAKTTVHLVRDVAEESHFPVLTSILERVNPTLLLANSAQDVSMIIFLSKACDISIVEDDDVTNTVDETFNSTKREEGVTENSGARQSVLPPRSCSMLEKEGEESQPEAGEEEKEGDGVEPVQQWVNEQPSKFSRSSQKSCTFSQSRRVQSKDDEEENLSEDEDEIGERGAPAIAAELQKLNNISYNFDRALVRIAESFESEALSVCESGLITRFRIDTASLNKALGIFAVDPGTDTTVRNIEHAKLINSDRFSLFGVCCRCRSVPGKGMLRKWFERPTREWATLQNRLDAVGFLANDDNKDIVAYLMRVLKPVICLKTTMKRLRSSNMKINDWIRLHSTVYLRELGQLLHPGRHSRLYIDYDESRVENRMVVRMGLDPDLDQMKEIYKTLPDNLTRAAKTEAARLGSPSSCSVGYVPKVGYLLQLPIHFDYEAYDDLEFLYADKDFLHVKSQMMRILDEKIGDIKMQIIDRETTIMLRYTTGTSSDLSFTSYHHMCTSCGSDRLIGLLTGILTRMYTLDGVLDGMSTFAKDVGQEVGLSLLTASVEHLVNKGKENCPHLLVSTHFHALIDLLETDKSAITYHVTATKRSVDYGLFERMLRNSREKGPLTSQDEITLGVKRLRSD